MTNIDRLTNGGFLFVQNSGNDLFQAVSDVSEEASDILASVKILVSRL